MECDSGYHELFQLEDGVPKSVKLLDACAQRDPEAVQAVTESNFDKVPPAKPPVPGDD